MRRILFSTLLTLPILAACGAATPDSSSDPVADQSDALSKAVPQADWLELVAPSLQSTQSASSQAPAQMPPPGACLGGPPARFADLTRKVTGDSNGLANGIFGIVAQVMSKPPASADPGHAVWGPITDPKSAAVYVLEVNKIADQTFRFELRGTPKANPSGPPVTVLDGVTTGVDPLHRMSDLHVDFGAKHALDPASDPVAGNAIIHVGVADAVRGVEITFGGVAGKMAPQPNDAHYLFHAGPDGADDFDFVTRTDFDHDGTLDELLHIQSMWAPGGAGRSHVVVTEGSLGPKQVNAAECWDPAGRTVFYADDINADPPRGDPKCCPNPPALTPPPQ
jgi:hypothetical protein